MPDFSLWLVFLAYAVWREWAHDRERNTWRTERGELLNRIQRPDFTPGIPEVQAPERPRSEASLWAAERARMLDDEEDLEPA